MTSEFTLLAEKVAQLAELARALRRENAELRNTAIRLDAENTALQDRMLQAHQRVEALLQQLPSAAQEQSRDAQSHAAEESL